MKLKPKGRKIYRRKDRFEHLKHVRQNIGSVIMTLLIAGAIGFVGYSAGAPVLRFLQERNFLAPPSSVAEHPQTETTPTESVSEPETEPVSGTGPDITEPPTEPETQPETESRLGFVQKAPVIRGYILDTSALMTESALQNALDSLPDGLTHVVIPLKIKGGEIWYATSVRDAARSNAVQAFLNLKTIYETVEEKGLTPVAMVNTLEDNLFAKTYPDSSYLLQNTGELWTDKSTEEGQLWLAPFSALTQEYLADIAEEIEMAGFRTLICDGLAYPNFPRMDLLELDQICSQDNRYEALTELLTAMRDKAPETAFFVRVDGDNALLGDMESVYAAEQLPADCLLISMSQENRRNYEQLTEISNAVPAVVEWADEKAPAATIRSYVLNP